MLKLTYMVLILATLPNVALGGPTNIRLGYEFAWGENIGWTNWRDANGGDEGVRVETTFLSGFIWAENVGWINVGDGSPVDGVRYANVDGLDSGVNIDDATGDLFGLAWGENIGWLNFDTRVALRAYGQQARLDFASGRFHGYVWAENAGWLNLDDATHFVACVPPPVIITWASMKEHDTGNWLAIPLDPHATNDVVAVESRADGIEVIDVTVRASAPFAVTDPVLAVDANNPGLTYPANLSPAVIDNGDDTWTVMLEWSPSLPDLKCYVIDLAGCIPDLVGDTDCMVRGVKGDVSGNGITDMGDVANLKNANEQSWHSTNWPQYDVTCNGGLIEMGDLVQSKTWGEQVPFPQASCP